MLFPALQQHMVRGCFAMKVTCKGGVIVASSLSPESDQECCALGERLFVRVPLLDLHTTSAHEVRRKQTLGQTWVAYEQHVGMSKAQLVYNAETHRSVVVVDKVCCAKPCRRGSRSQNWIPS